MSTGYHWFWVTQCARVLAVLPTALPSSGGEQILGCIAPWGAIAHRVAMVEADTESEAAALRGTPGSWSPPEVADWLRGLHLPEAVAERFLHNAVAGAGA